jgi:hypothetical protein
MDNLLSGKNKEGISCAEHCDYVALMEQAANEISTMDNDAT